MNGRELTGIDACAQEKDLYQVTSDPLKTHPEGIEADQDLVQRVKPIRSGSSCTSSEVSDVLKRNYLEIRGQSIACYTDQFQSNYRYLRARRFAGKFPNTSAPTYPDHETHCSKEKQQPALSSTIHHYK